MSLIIYKAKRSKYRLCKELSLQSWLWTLSIEQARPMVSGCVMRTWIHASTWWLSAAVSSSTCIRSTAWSCCRVSHIFCDQRGKPLVDDCSCHSHAACGRKNEWWKLSTFDFSYSLVISPFLLHLVPVTALSQKGVAVDRHERIEIPKMLHISKLPSYSCCLSLDSNAWVTSIEYSYIPLKWVSASPK